MKTRSLALFVVFVLWGGRAPAESFFLELLPEAIPAPASAIAVVIDDMGVDTKRSARAVRLPAAVTLSYLAYAPRLETQVTAAKEAGHEICLHLPWEPNSDHADPGPDALISGMPKEQLKKNLIKNLDAFAGYDCVNNHMGSKFSRDSKGLDIVMAELKRRDLVFLDSRTVPHSIAEKIARMHGLAATHRDVFLDRAVTHTDVAAAIKKAEDTARRQGLAIVIGHPKDMTLAHLEAWLPTLEKKGFHLISLKEAILQRQQQRDNNLAKGEQNHE